MIVCRQFREGAVDPRVAARPLSSCLLRSQSEPLDVIILPAAGRGNERLDGAGRCRAHCPTHCPTGHGQRRATLCKAQAMRRSEEHTSELQSLMRISYAVFCLKKKKTINTE